jgi:CrcB protein
MASFRKSPYVAKGAAVISSSTRPDWRQLGAIFLGGAIGAVLRVELSLALPSVDGSWPWIILAINVSGSFVLGYVVTRLQERLPLSTYRRPLLGTGFCGAYTTFSTMQLELLKMIDVHRDGLAVTYAVVSVVAGYLAIFAATALVRRVRVF